MLVFYSLFLKKQQQKPTAVLLCLKARHAVVTCDGLIWAVVLLPGSILESYLGILGPPSPPALLSFRSVRGVLSLVSSKLLTSGQHLRRKTGYFHILQMSPPTPELLGRRVGMPCLITRSLEAAISLHP